MEQKNKILIISGMIVLVAVGVFYFLILPLNGQIKAQNEAIGQIKSQIAAKQNYYNVVEAKLQALSDAGWADKEKMIAVNFTSSPFYVAKMSYFFRTVAAGSGVTISNISAAPAVSVKTVAQTSTKEKETVQISTEKTAEEQKQVVSTGYLDQLKGPVKKITFTLAVTGTYSSFKKFLSDLETQTRIITVKNIEVVSSGDSGTGKKTVSLTNFNLTVDAYSY
ncbi:MAG: type 4a pilus biogenesis protein PilO [Candidatus Paceibacterota bacterium]